VQELHRIALSREIQAIEVRICRLETTITRQHLHIAWYQDRGLEAVTSHALLRSFQDSLALYHWRRNRLLVEQRA